MGGAASSTVMRKVDVSGPLSRWSWNPAFFSRSTWSHSPLSYCSSTRVGDHWAARSGSPAGSPACSDSLVILVGSGSTTSAESAPPMLSSPWHSATGSAPGCRSQIGPFGRRVAVDRGTTGEVRVLGTVRGHRRLELVDLLVPGKKRFHRPRAPVMGL